MSVFNFKKFSIKQDRSAMKVNTDGVLLGAWMHIKSDYRNFLDIGTGTGVIALMCAQRYNDGDFIDNKLSVAQSFKDEKTEIKKIEIDAIDIDGNSIKDARENVKNSPWKDINVIETSLENYIPNKYYDLIFTNPPYFSNSLKNTSLEKAAARHNHSLSQSQIINSALKLLKHGGCLAIILPSYEAREFIKKVEFISNSKSNKLLIISRLCSVSTTDKKVPKRIMMEFTASKRDSQDNEIIINSFSKEKLAITTNGSYSEAYLKLTTTFYLNL